jgi:hypothetical protein
LLNCLRADLDLRILVYATAAGILVILYTFLVPLFQHLTGGLVAGLICGYRIGRLGGIAHALVAGVLTGIVAGGVAVVPGWLVGLFLEPNTLLTSTMGLLSVRFDVTTVAGLSKIGGFLVFGVTLDALVGAILGDWVKAAVEHAAKLRE